MTTSRHRIIFGLFLVTLMRAGLSNAGTIGSQVHMAPVGAWSEYKVSGQGSQGIRRFALMAREPSSSTFEIQFQDTSAPGNVHLTRKVGIRHMPDGTERKTPLAIQVGSHDPMEAPLPPRTSAVALQDPLVPQKLVGRETIRVPAGVFAAEHYHDTMPNGLSLDLWQSDQVFPTGMVKMTITKVHDKSIVVIRAMELTRQGWGAVPTITKATRPFDKALYAQQILGGALSRLGRNPGP